MSNPLVTTPQQQREAVRAQLSPTDVAYVDRMVAEGLQRTAPGSCACGGHRLNPDVVPVWLRAAIGIDTPVYGPEAGYPQMCRVSSYVDWLAVAEAMGDHLQADDTFWPTTVAAKWCESLRPPHHGGGKPVHAEWGACVDVAIWVDGVDRFRVEAWALCTAGPLASPEMANQIDSDLGEGLKQIEERHGDAGDYFFDAESFSWQFC